MQINVITSDAADLNAITEIRPRPANSRFNLSGGELSLSLSTQIRRNCLVKFVIPLPPRKLVTPIGSMSKDLRNVKLVSHTFSCILSFQSSARLLLLAVVLVMGKIIAHFLFLSCFCARGKNENKTRVFVNKLALLLLSLPKHFQFNNLLTKPYTRTFRKHNNIYNQKYIDI